MSRSGHQVWLVGLKLQENRRELKGKGVPLLAAVVISYFTEHTETDELNMYCNIYCCLETTWHTPKVCKPVQNSNET